MAYMVFRIVSVELFPTEGQKLALEKIFGSVRNIHNLFVTQLQSFNDEEAKRMVRNYTEVKSEIANMVECPDNTYSYLKNLDRSIITSHMQIISSVWTDFAKGIRQRPMFKQPMHHQAFWILSAYRLKVTRDRLTIPGPEGIEFLIPQGVLNGAPSACKVARDKNDRYWVTLLYEQTAEVPGHDNIITVWGVRLKKLLTKLSSRECRVWKPGRRTDNVLNLEHDVAILRMKILGKLLKNQNYKEVQDVDKADQAVLA